MSNAGITGEKKTVIVLGKGRSGTSVTAGILNILGVDMGADVSPTPFNPRGAFEDLDFNELNAEILKSAGSGGEDWCIPPSYEQILAQKERFNERIKTLIVKKSNSRIWGWKKPTTSLLIELFLPYLVNPHFVVIFRNPISTAKSSVELSRHRTNIELFQALKITTMYNKAIIDFLEKYPNLPRIFIAFEDAINHPIKEAKRLADFIGLPLTEDKTKEINKFVISRDAIKIQKKLSFFKSIPPKSRRLIQKSQKEPTKILVYMYQGLKLFIGIFFKRRNT